LKTALSSTQRYPWDAKENSAKNSVGPKFEKGAILRLVSHKLKSQTDTRTKQLHKNFKLNLQLKPQLRSTNNQVYILLNDIRDCAIITWRGGEGVGKWVKYSSKLSRTPLSLSGN